METNQEGGRGLALFNKYAPLAVIGFAFLLPIFFIPISSISLPLGKALLVTIFAILLFVGIVLEKLKSGSISFPRSWFAAALVLIPFSYLISSFFSSSVAESLIGGGVEVDTAFTASILLLVFFVTTLILKTKNHLFNFFVGIFVSFFVLAIFEILRFFGGADILSFGIFNSITSNTIGTWNEVALFSGFIVILSLVSLELLPKAGLMRYVVYAAFILGLFLMVVVNFSLAWYLTGIFALALFVYGFSYGRDLPSDGVKVGGLPARASIPPLVVILISILFIILGSSISPRISNYFGISQVEARPAWQSTLSLMGSALGESPIFGVGPNQFSRLWVKEKPVGVNESLFWNVDFNSGVGYVPTSFITGGLLAGISWIIVISLFVLEGVKLFRRRREDQFNRYLTIAAFVGALYLLTVAIFYAPTLSLLVLLFLMFGVFVASLILEGEVKIKTFLYSKESSTNFATILALIVLLAGSATGTFFFGQRFVSSLYFNNAALAFNSGNIALAESGLRSAIAIGATDSHYRALSQTALLRLGEVASRADSETQETTRANFELYLGGAIQSAQLARDYDPSNYQNWLSLGRAYETVVAIPIEGAYENAKASYEEAYRLAPKNPLIPLTLARLEVVNKNNEAARAKIAEARALKNNYTDAIFLLSQIEINEGNVDEAIKSVESAAVIAPNDPVVYFQLGFLKYNDRQYKGAISALEKSISIQPSYANAKYFLGLSYYQDSRRNDAIKQFEDIVATNPDNQEVQFILNNLKAGRSPFANVQPPLDDSPEDRSELPISEEEGL